MKLKSRHCFASCIKRDLFWLRRKFQENRLRHDKKSTRANFRVWSHVGSWLLFVVLKRIFQEFSPQSKQVSFDASGEAMSWLWLHVRWVVIFLEPNILRTLAFKFNANSISGRKFWVFSSKIEDITCLLSRHHFFLPICWYLQKSIIFLSINWRH